MRFFGRALLVVAVVVLSVTVVVYAQGRASGAAASIGFLPVLFESGNGGYEEFGLHVMEVRLSNGVSCYSLTTRSSAFNLDSLGNLGGFSCVK